MKDRRGRGEGALYRRHERSCPPIGPDGERPDHRCKGLWVAVLDLGVVDGRRKRVTVAASTKTAARTKFLDVKTAHEKGATFNRRRQTVGEWLNHWLDTIAAANVRERTLRGYRSYADTWLIPQLGAVRLDQLHQDHVRRLLTEMSEGNRSGHASERGRPCSEATKRQARAVLRKALDDAVADGHLAVNVAAGVKAPKTHTERRVPLTVDEAQAVLLACGDDPMLSRWIVALYLGLRQGEALGLRWEDVDLPVDPHDPSVIRIRYALQRVPGKGLVLVPPKTEKSRRDIEVPAFVTPALWHRRRLVPASDPFVWSDGAGNGRDPKRDWSEWKALLTRAGVEDHPLHAARGTTATLLRLRGVDPVIVAEILGHTTVQTADRFYVMGNRAARQDAMGKLDGDFPELPALAAVRPTDDALRRAISGIPSA